MLYEKSVKVTKKPYRVSHLSPEEEKEILSFLQGAVYCWCNNHEDNFAASNFVGGGNANWDKTPLQPIYDGYLVTKSSKTAKKTAKKTTKKKTKKITKKTASKAAKQAAFDKSAKAIGHLLKTVLINDKRRFNLIPKSGYQKSKEYQWDGKN